MKVKKPYLMSVCLLTVLLLVLAGMVGGLLFWESANTHSESAGQPADGRKTIIRDGVEYYPRQDITTILLLGIDEEGPAVSSGSYRNRGEADAVMLLILDQTDESYTVLCLNRDTMIEMDTLGVRGEYAGTAYGQLALAHTFGSGMQDSCENVKNSLTNFLPGLFIDYYVALRMDAIALVNDLVGGVEVTVTDDFSAVDSSLKKGQVKLQGDQALTFVQTRKDVGNQLNISRMERHRAYMEGLMEAMTQKFHGNDMFIFDLYEQMEDYMVTDCSVNVINGLMQRCSDYRMKEVVSPEGQNRLGEEFYEFHVDREKLDSLRLRLLYAPKKNN